MHDRFCFTAEEVRNLKEMAQLYAIKTMKKSKFESKCELWTKAYYCLYNLGFSHKEIIKMINDKK